MSLTDLQLLNHVYVIGEGTLAYSNAASVSRFRDKDFFQCKTPPASIGYTDIN
jgi:hypothetical protein